MLQMHYVRALRKVSQAVDNNMAACPHPLGLGTEGRREDHWRVAGPPQRIGQQLHHRF